MRLELEVRRVGGPAFVQDLGRPGHLAEGVPHGGALTPELLAATNRALGNLPGAAALEVYGELELGVRRPGSVAIDGSAERVVEGQVLRVTRPSKYRARYLAVPGGLDVPLRLGGRGTLELVGLGGFEGRALRRGDVLGSREPGELGAATTEGVPWDGLRRPVRVVLGPDTERFPAEAEALLRESAFVISPSSNRVGTRLLGPSLPRLTGDDAISTPMVAGAIQVPASGEPIVLGPDHPTLGGYPVIGVILRVDHGALFARRPGATVRFEVVSLAEARAAAIGTLRSDPP